MLSSWTRIFAPPVSSNSTVHLHMLFRGEGADSRNVAVAGSSGILLDAVLFSSSRFFTE